mgnify:CR=1 FL=1
MEKELIEMYASTNKTHTHNHLKIDSANFKSRRKLLFRLVIQEVYI